MLENNMNNVILEEYEWDSLWWEQTGDNQTPRVLYIGDSISDGIRRNAQAASGEKILFDRFGTSKALDNPFFIESLRCFSRQQGRRNVIVLNNGLHGWHLDDVEEYGRYYEEMVRFLLEEYEGTPLVLVLTTSVAGKLNKRVNVRNEIVKGIAAKYGLPVIDLYAASLKYFSFITADGVHFSEEGYQKLAKEFLNEINKYSHFLF